MINFFIIYCQKQDVIYKNRLKIYLINYGSLLIQMTEKKLLISFVRQNYLITQMSQSKDITTNQKDFFNKGLATDAGWPTKNNNKSQGIVTNDRQKYNKLYVRKY